MNSSFTIQTRIVKPQDLNGQKRLFGGRLMEWIDEVAGISSRRYCHANVTTASIDRLDFLSGAHLNDTIVLEAQVTYTGHTSMEVMVRTYVEYMNGERHMINTAYLVEVAIDAQERPCRVPEFIPETDEEKQLWEAAKKRKEMRNERRSTGA